ncbi:MAG: DUF7453 family protein [Candidatus Anammoxibacter sp.]
MIKTILTRETELVPDTGLTAFDLSRSHLSMNNNGDIVFNVLLKSGSKSIVLYSGGKIKLLFKEVFAQPLNEEVFLEVGDAVINDNGDIVFVANRSGKQGIYKLLNDDTIPLVIAGDSVLGLEATIEEFRFSFFISLNNNGEIAFYATLSDGREGVFMLKGETVKPIAISGDPFPVFSGNETIKFVFFPRINDKGEIAVKIIFGDIDNLSRTGIFLFRDSGEVVTVALSGDKAPGTDGQVFWRLQPGEFIPALGEDSEVVFWGRYIAAEKELPHSSKGTKLGMFLWSDSETKPLILTGDPVPGINDTFFNIGNLPSQNATNDNGDIVSGFNSILNLGGVMLFSDDKAVPVVLGSSPPAGTVVLYFFRWASINNNGDIAFVGDPSVTPHSSKIYFATRENVSFEAANIEPDIGTNDSRLKVEITGTGFQPGAQVSFKGDGIRVLRTAFKISTRLVARIRIADNAKPGLRDVLITNPDGEETVLEDGFEVKK